MTQTRKWLETSHGRNSMSVLTAAGLFSQIVLIMKHDDLGLRLSVVIDFGAWSSHCRLALDFARRAWSKKYVHKVKSVNDLAKTDDCSVSVSFEIQITMMSVSDSQCTVLCYWCAKLKKKHICHSPGICWSETMRWSNDGIASQLSACHQTTFKHERNTNK